MSNVQAVRAAIEKMAEEGEVYTGVFTQVRTMKIMKSHQIDCFSSVLRTCESDLCVLHCKVKKIHAFVEENTGFSKKDVRLE